MLSPNLFNLYEYSNARYRTQTIHRTHLFIMAQVINPMDRSFRREGSLQPQLGVVERFACCVTDRPLPVYLYRVDQRSGVGYFKILGNDSFLDFCHPTRSSERLPYLPVTHYRNTNHEMYANNCYHLGDQVGNFLEVQFGISLSGPLIKLFVCYIVENNSPQMFMQANGLKKLTNHRKFLWTQ